MKKDNAMKVIGIGDNVVDDYIHIRTMFPGGNALNFSVFASLLGCEAAYLGVFGSDAAAKHVQQTLSGIGIDTSHCRSADGPNGRALLKIEDGERIFISSNKGGVSKSVPMAFIFDDLDYLQSFSIVHTSLYSYMDPYLPQLRQLKALISYDFSDSFKTEHVLSLCEYIDIAFFSCAEQTEEATKELLELAVNNGCILAVATRGPHETVLFDGRSWYRQVPKAVKPKDTLGAGDAFITGFLISYAEGKANAGIQTAELINHSLEKAAAFASEICQVQGAFGYGLSY